MRRTFFLFLIAGALLLPFVSAAGGVTVTDEKYSPATAAGAPSLFTPALVSTAAASSLTGSFSTAEADKTAVLDSAYATQCYQTYEDQRNKRSPIQCGLIVKKLTEKLPLGCPNIVQPFLVVCSITSESDNVVQSKSGKGAKGPLQVMPGTWSDMDAKLGGKLSDPYDAKDGLMAGMAYQQWLVKDAGIGCNLENLVRSYNAGPYSKNKHNGETENYYRQISSCYDGYMQKYNA
jgi:hypothetical protein